MSSKISKASSLLFTSTHLLCKAYGRRGSINEPRSSRSTWPKAMATSTLVWSWKACGKGSPVSKHYELSAFLHRGQSTKAYIAYGLQGNLLRHIHKQAVLYSPVTAQYIHAHNQTRLLTKGTLAEVSQFTTRINSFGALSALSSSSRSSGFSKARIGPGRRVNVDNVFPKHVYSTRKMRICQYTFRYMTVENQTHRRCQKR